MEKVRLLDKFTWRRRYRAAPRVPLYYLEQDGGDVYFVNNSGETLDSVSSGSCGMQTVDDDVVSVGGPACSYENVKPGEAVKVESYHAVLDSDFLMQLDVGVSSPSKGRVAYRCWAKGGVTSVVLLWDDGRPGSGVGVVREDGGR
jgi:hypothetical protein